MEFTKVEDGELLKFTDDKAGKLEVTGVLRSYTPRKDTGKGPGHVYEIENKDGITAFFAPSLLHKKLQNVAIGNIVNIKFTKVSKTANGNTLKNFEVAWAKSSPEALKSIGMDVNFETVAEDDFDTLGSEEEGKKKK